MPLVGLGIFLLGGVAGYWFAMYINKVRTLQKKVAEYDRSLASKVVGD